MKKFISVCMFFFLVWGFCYGAENFGQDGLEIKYSLYLLPERVSPDYPGDGYTYPQPAPASSPYFQTLYHIRCAAQITNRTAQPVENLNLNCVFEGNNKKIAENPITMSLKPGETVRRIFYSGISTRQTGSGATARSLDTIYMTPEQEKSFLNNASVIKLGTGKSLTTVIDLTMTTVKCRFRIFYENRDFDYKNY